ncbi:MAG: ribonuclease P protein component [Pseudomonadota bacterium]
MQNGGSKWISPTVIMVQMPRETTDAKVRYGLTVTKRTAKRAVDRNRIKRRLRAASAEALQGMAGLDIVIMARLPVLNCTYPALVKDIKWCLKRLNQPQPA